MYNESDPFTEEHYEDDEDRAYNHGHKAGQAGKPNSPPIKFLNVKQEWINGWNDGDELRIKQLDIEKHKNAPNKNTLNILKKLLEKSKP